MRSTRSPIARASGMDCVPCSTAVCSPMPENCGARCTAIDNAVVPFALAFLLLVLEWDTGAQGLGI
eukprot:1993240-Pyramimonas_sp.AAC.1